MHSHTKLTACLRRSCKMLRSISGSPGGTVMVMLDKKRGALAWPMRVRCAALLICDSACVITSASMILMSELRL